MKFILIALLMTADMPVVIEYNNRAACEEAKRIIWPALREIWGDKNRSAFCTPKGE